VLPSAQTSCQERRKILIAWIGIIFRDKSKSLNKWGIIIWAMWKQWTDRAEGWGILFRTTLQPYHQVRRVELTLTALSLGKEAMIVMDLEI
jgi:hypothetical protein